MTFLVDEEITWRERLKDPPWAGRNAHAQLFLTGLGLAAWIQLAPRLPEPAVIAGYSVGEMAAFAAAGVCSPRDAIDLAQHRAALMDRDAERCATGLFAVSGLAQEMLEPLCADFGLALAIRNDPVSVVLGGPKAGRRRGAAHWRPRHDAQCQRRLAHAVDDRRGA